MHSHIDINDYIGMKTLITGDVNTGKTHHCRKILHALINAGSNNIAVLDFAPATTKGIGGKLVPPENSGAIYFSAPISAPRLSGRNETEILNLARQNACIIDSLIDAYLIRPRDILFINDVTLYLHAGGQERILLLMQESATVVINAYYGSSFPDITLSAHEKHAVEKLIRFMDQVIRL